MPKHGNDDPQIAVELTNREETVAALTRLSDVTHIFYEARFDHPEGEGGSIETNTAMFRNLDRCDRAAGTAPGQSHCMDGDGTRLRQSGFQYHQW